MSRRVAILGAGPIGLEAALAAVQRGDDVTVHERAAGVGGNVARWAHVRMFTPWEMNVSPRVRAALGAAAPTGSHLPTGREVVEQLLEPLAALPQLAGRVRTGTQVMAVGRQGLLKHEEVGSAARAARPFRLLLRDVAGGEERVAHADVVIDATGVSGTPNRLGDGGIDAPGEARFDERIDRELVDLARDPAAWAGRTVLLTGAGHSAQTAARELAALARDAPGTRVVWAVRAATPTFGVVPDDVLPERAALGATALDLLAGAHHAVTVLTGAVTEALQADGGRIRVTLRNGAPRDVVVDRILALNGGVGDASIYRQLQVHECYASLGPMRLAATLAAPGGDCLAAPAAGGLELLRNPEPDFFILGAKSYGRNSQFLLRTGSQQVDDVFGAPPEPPA